MAQSNALPQVLLVEDEPLIRDLLQGALEDGGFEVAYANNGDGAIDVLQSRPGEFAGVVTDVDLGGGMTGWDVGHAARRISPVIAVVYMSGASSHQWESEGVPGSTMLMKPFAPAQLLVALATQINNADSRVDDA
ncbi:MULTISPECIES: response regulator [unclassified Phenylobacterium]|jgi:two-component system, cell cycle response regulator CpdR|uniref:response regulator n=1 Tax=unclassified Phenylobacterium TaxID=2640670 RepID=UPI000839DB25|nr:MULTISPECIES: response regulator [unclassified Phenylobacterium]